MKEYIAALEYLSSNPSLERVTHDSSEVDVLIVKQLYSEGYVDAIDASSLDGPCYLNPRVSLRGREWLESKQKPSSGSSNEIFEFKPNFYGVGVNLKALWRKCFPKT